MFHFYGFRRKIWLFIRAQSIVSALIHSAPVVSIAHPLFPCFGKLLLIESGIRKSQRKKPGSLGKLIREMSKFFFNASAFMYSCLIQIVHLIEDQNSEVHRKQRSTSETRPTTQRHPNNTYVFIVLMKQQNIVSMFIHNYEGKIVEISISYGKKKKKKLSYGKQTYFLCKSSFYSLCKVLYRTSTL